MTKKNYGNKRPVMRDFERAKMGDRVYVQGFTWMRLDDRNPPYTSNMWVNTATGETCCHWSGLFVKAFEGHGELDWAAENKRSKNA
jgi:hypothetical protein